MATVKGITANGNYDIGGSPNTGYVIVLISGTFTGNVTPQARPFGSATEVVAASENGYDAPYITRGTMAKVAAGTALTNVGRVIIPACGETISLLIESYSAGPITVTYANVDGPAPTSWWA